MTTILTTRHRPPPHSPSLQNQLEERGHLTPRYLGALRNIIRRWRMDWIAIPAKP